MRSLLERYKRICEGRCRDCGARRNLYAHLCDGCREKEKVRQRTANGYNAWRPGGRGRKPAGEDRK